MPNFNQLQQTIAQDDDSINNRLILNVNGDFELRPFNDATDDYNFQRLNYVTRWEAFVVLMLWLVLFILRHVIKKK